MKKRRAKPALAITMLAIVWMMSSATLSLSETVQDAGLSTLEQQALGTKYPDQPMEERVGRLEQTLHSAVKPGATMSYRISRLFALQEAQASRQNHERAIQAYNQAIDQTAKGEPDQAMESYRSAIQADPGMVEAYNNLANIMLEQHHYPDTVALYQQGIALRPNEPLLHRNLGVLYEKLGNIPESIGEYKAYLQLTDKPDAPIEQIVKTYQTYRKAGMGSPDYAVATTEATHGQVLLWAEKSNPIRIYIRAENPDQRFVPEVLQNAMDAWKVATNGRLQFRSVDSADQANILIKLKDGPLSDPNADIGHTEYTMPEHQLLEHRMDRVLITLNTGNEENRRTLPLENRKAQVYRMALHELGHAIGIWGHSPDPGDIMFTHPIAAGLSTRDVNTVRKLYGL